MGSAQQCARPGHDDHSRQRVCYPEVTGYFIPTLLASGLRDLAHQYARWLVSVQKPDGSFGGGGEEASFAFDTAQVVRGWVEVAPQMPELETTVATSLRVAPENGRPTKRAHPGAIAWRGLESRAAWRGERGHSPLRPAAY